MSESDSPAATSPANSGGTEPTGPGPTGPESTGPESTGPESTGPEPAEPDSPLDGLHTLLTHATQQLLGATIEVSDERWREPSRLPGWTRGHLATHLARNAEGVGRLANWARTGRRQSMYASEEQRDADVAAGAERPGVELQVDLDTTAGRLDDAFAALAEEGDWDTVVEARGTEMPARLLPLVRLNEVALHLIDLDVGRELADLDPDTTGWLLEYAARKLRDRADFPRLELNADSGFHAVIGAAGEERRVSGAAGDLLGWLTGRGGSERIAGADGLELPAFG